MIFECLRIPKKKLEFIDAQMSKVDQNRVRKKVQKLMEISFDRVMGTRVSVPDEMELSAIWFDFIKFQLTNFIIDKLTPDSWNFTCKDGIDRARVHSIYYNLFRDNAQASKLTQENMQQILHAASNMVKGRDMNEHQYALLSTVRLIANSGNNSQHEHAAEHIEKATFGSLKEPVIIRPSSP